MHRHRLLPVLFLTLSLGAMTTNGEEPFYTECPSNMNYSRGSAFQANLDALLSSLPVSAAASSGFARKVTGTAPDQAYGLAQCRADVNASDCRSCLNASAPVVASRCPGQKSAMIVYESCLLRYFNTSFFGATDTSFAMYRCTWQNATQSEQFMLRLGTLMSNLTGKAAYQTPRMFAAGMVDVTPFVKLYGMAQCTRDLAADDCNACLSSVVALIPAFCDGKRGGQIYYRSCSVWFDVYPFYNARAVEVAMSPAPAPGAGPVNRSDDLTGPQGTGKLLSE